MLKIKLWNSNETFLIDDDDINLVSKYHWHKLPEGEIWAKVDGKTLYLHRYLLNCPKGLTVDHINHNRSDNRRENLRICTYSQNNYNRRSGRKESVSKYKGVRKNSFSDRWIVEVVAEGKTYNCGSYLSEEYAAHIYNRNANIIQGNFAYLNKITISEDEAFEQEKILQENNRIKLKRKSKQKYVSHDGYKWIVQKWDSDHKKLIQYGRFETENEAILKAKELLS